MKTWIIVRVTKQGASEAVQQAAAYECSSPWVHFFDQDGEPLLSIKDDDIVSIFPKPDAGISEGSPGPAGTADPNG